MSADEAELVQQIRMGDSTGLALYLDVKRPQLLAFIRQNLSRALQSHIEPEDVLQDTAIAALRALPTADFSSRDPFSWLCHLTEQRIIDRARELDADKRDVQREVSGHERVVGQEGSSAELIDLLAASLTSVTKAVVRNERHARLQECLARLPESTQEILRMRFVEGVTTRVIAERLGKSDGAVRVWVSRTLRELQAALGVDGKNDNTK